MLLAKNVHKQACTNNKRTQKHNASGSIYWTGRGIPTSRLSTGARTRGAHARRARTHASTHARTHTHTRLTALFLGLPRWAGTRKGNQSGFYCSKRQWVAVASAGPYASLHLAPDIQPCQHPTTQSHSSQSNFRATKHYSHTWLPIPRQECTH